MSAYSCNALFGVMLTASSPGATVVTSAPIGAGAPTRRARRGGESIWASSTRRPARTAARARVAANVVRPTPPLPETTTKRRSRSWAAAMSEVVEQPEAGAQARAEQVQLAPVVGGEGGDAEGAGVVQLGPQVEALLADGDI